MLAVCSANNRKTASAYLSMQGYCLETMLLLLPWSIACQPTFKFSKV